MSWFDCVIIGSGPAAIAALDAFETPLRIAVIDGAVPAAARNSQIHPKIRAVASSAHEPAGVAELLPAESGDKPLFSTAAVGGLANYWGQQFLTVHSSDAWPRRVFASHTDFLAGCAAIEAPFRIEGGQTIENNVAKATGFDFFTPRLLAGVAGSSVNAFSAMEQVFRKIVEIKKARTFTARAVSFHKAGTGWTIRLSNGHEVSAARIVLAAGVIGNAQIMFHSYNDLGMARFCDHTPWMIYTLGLSLPALLENNHFNVATLERARDDRSAVYASVYDMRHADLNLLAASAIGMTAGTLGRLRPPAIVKYLKPVQVWTENTTERVDIHRNNGAVHYTTSPAASRPDDDEALGQTIDVLKALGATILKVGQTTAGYGFHYHALEFQTAGKALRSATELLLDRTAGDVTCVDASVLPAISCRPPTLMAMAAARQLARQLERRLTHQRLRLPASAALLQTQRYKTGVAVG
jgi:hypothetical protein